MSESLLANMLLHSNPAEALELAWNSEDLTLAQRARVISALHMRSRMTLEGTARMTGANPAQIFALIQLATLDDNDLELISQFNPPATTWFLFAGADSDVIKAGLEALVDSVKVNDSQLLRVYEAMKRIDGPTQDERILAITGDTLRHLVEKAAQYSKLNPKSLKFLSQMARDRSTGKLISEKQLKWLKDILLELVNENVVSRNSMDNDQVVCDEVMDALGI